MKRMISLVIFTLSMIFIAGGAYIGIVYALNSWDTGYQLTSGQVRDMNLADSTCKRVTNNATNRFIGTKTMAEWNSFNAVAASQGVTVAGCGPTYPGCSTSDIVIPSIGQSWAACNKGATTPSGYGDYYQWGMNTTTYSTNFNLPAGGWPAGTCAAGYHVPTAAEITALSESSEAIAMGAPSGRGGTYGAGRLLNLPLSNLKYSDPGSPYNPGANSWTWCADRGVTVVRTGIFYPDSVCIVMDGGSLNRGTNTVPNKNEYSMPIRCKHD